MSDNPPASTDLEASDPDAREAQTFLLCSAAEPTRVRVQGIQEVSGNGQLVFSCGIVLQDATTRSSVFAIGDVRSGSVKRVASGVGEGSVVIQAVHHVLNPGVA